MPNKSDTPNRRGRGIVKAFRFVLVAFACAVFFSGNLQAQRPASEHTVVVYWKPGRYAAWPANHGIWSWGNEILVGFEVGYFKKRGSDAHPISHERPAEDLLARSLDGGETWTIESTRICFRRQERKKQEFPSWEEENRIRIAQVGSIFQIPTLR